MIPKFTELGLLPEVIHRATLAEFEERFVTTVERRRLFNNVKKLLAEARSSGIVKCVIIAGSFVTTKPEPNDFDCLIVLDRSVLGRELRPFEYALASRRRARKAFGGDVLPAVDGTQLYRERLAFYQRTRQNQPMGLVEIEV